MAEPKAQKLNPRQRRFVEEYLVDLNGTQAATRAGYAEKSARFTAADLLARPAVQEAIALGQAARSKRTQVDADRVVLELARIAFADIRKAVSWKRVDPVVDLPKDDPRREADHLKPWWSIRIKDSADMPDDIAVTISELKEGKDGQLGIKFHSKTRALELLAKHLGLLEKADTGSTEWGEITKLTPDNIHDIREAARRRVAAK